MKIFVLWDDRGNSARRDDSRISPGNTSHSQTRGFLIRIFILIINNFLSLLTLWPWLSSAKIFGTRKSSWRIQIKYFANEGQSWKVNETTVDHARKVLFTSSGQRTGHHCQTSTLMVGREVEGGVWPFTAVRCPVTMTQDWGISNIDISILSNDFLTLITYISGNLELISDLLIIVKIIINSKHISDLSVDIMTPIIMGIITVNVMTIFYLESVKHTSMNNLHSLWIRKIIFCPFWGPSRLHKKNFKNLLQKLLW